MYRLFFIGFVSLFIGCAAPQQQTSTTADDITPVITAPKKYITFGFSSSGLGNRPSDAFRLDSTKQMTYTTRSRVSGEDFKEVTGMAFLEEQDYFRFYSIVERGNLTAMDSSDVGVKCPHGSGEMMTLSLKASDRPRAVTLIFDECATEYNLLLEPQRTAFHDLVNWFQSMRPKYRPYRPAGR